MKKIDSFKSWAYSTNSFSKLVVLISIFNGTYYVISETLQLFHLCETKKNVKYSARSRILVFLDLGGSEDVKNGISTAIFERILRAKREQKTFRCFSLICPG
jgi:hypothetical protein